MVNLVIDGILDLIKYACVCVWMESGGGGDLVCKEDQKNENEIG